MTVSTSTNSVVYRGNGATTEFAVPFKVLNEDHLVVTSRDFVTGVLFDTYVGTDFTYSGVGDDAGTLTLSGPALIDDYELVIERVVPYTQDLDIVNAGGFYAETVEEQLDLMTMGIQQIADLAGRGAVVPVGEDGFVLPKAADRAGTFFAFDADGNYTPASGTGGDSALRTDLAGVTGASLVGLADGRSAQTVFDEILSCTVSLKRFEIAGEPIGTGNVAYDDGAIARAVAFMMSARRAAVINAGYTYPSTVILFPPGDYKTAGGHGAALELLGLWAFPNTVTITNTANTYMFSIPNRLDFTYMSGIRFIGGKGVLRHSFVGDNVSGEHIVERCYFYDYTEAAISSDSANIPYWHIFDNFFYGKAASGTLTKGVAIGGLLDNSVIERNHFLRNNIHLQIGPLNSGNVQVLDNDFLSFEADRTDYDIWCIPSNLALFGTGAGQGTRFVGNKFGNENITDPAKKAPRMLVAAISGGSTNRATCTPDLTWKNGNTGINWLVGLSFSTNRISSTNIDGNGGVDASFMDIYIEKMDRLFWAADNVVEDGYLNNIFNHVDSGARIADRRNTSWEVHIGSGLRTFNGALLRNNVSSHQIGPIHDPLGIVPGPSALLPAGAHDPGEVSLVQALSSAGWSVEAGVTAVAAANPHDGAAMTATEFNWTTAGAFAYLTLPNMAAYAGSMAWIGIEFQTDATPIAKMEILLRNSVGLQEQFHDFFTPPTGMTAIFIPWQVPAHASPATFQFCVTTPVRDATHKKLIVGKCRLTVSRSAPVLQRSAAIADATDAASAISQLNLVIAALEARNVLES